MLACLGHLKSPKYPMGLTQVPKPMALTAFVMLSFQCFVASSLAQSMPHSCSFKDPMCFPFSISGYMPATKIKSLHSTACILSDSMSLLSKFVPYGDRNFKDRCGIKLKIIKKTNPVNIGDHVPSTHVPHVWSFLIPKFQEAHPITKVDP